MPLFSSFSRSSRSKKSRRLAQDESFSYYDTQRHDEPHSAPAWRTVTPNAPSRDTRESWAEVDYPESYSGLGDYNRGASSSGSSSRRRRGGEPIPIPIHESDRHSQSTVTALDQPHYAQPYADTRYAARADTYDDDDSLYEDAPDHHGGAHQAHHGGYDGARYDSSIPLVQRESSHSRLTDAFADHAPAARPVTEVSLPQGTPYPSPGPVPMAASMSGVPRTRSASTPGPGRPPLATPMPGPSRSRGMTTPGLGAPSLSGRQPSARMRSIYAEPRQPVVVPQGPNMAVRSERPEYVGRAPSSGHRGRREERRAHDEREYRRRERSDDSGRTPDDSEDEYPPCVVVVERGRNGKKDTYYVIPGGAPVIFEDDHGHELTRVGDFSGRYKPRRQRPVIIEDEQGREIGRLGFDDESSLDYNYRKGSYDDGYERDRGYDSRRGGDRDHYDDRGSSRSHRSHRSQQADRDYAPEGPQDYPRSRTISNGSRPNLVYIPHKDTMRSTSYHSEDRSSRRQGYEPSQRSHHSRHSSSSRSHNNASPVIHLDDMRHRSPESVASGSSGRYDDDRSYQGSRRR
ncbi:hypothetical protein PsYK624_007840 [Phanerochaete sordida]|uniref:Uncharacterized protein n=1 Tax=Phanerochaete sordida TaxID=48140 RepID=A0A9P3FX39_9APHY|nr:hypothetical protein PsYK624_007840 [Phanerochaete sordida]